MSILPLTGGPFGGAAEAVFLSSSFAIDAAFLSSPYAATDAVFLTSPFAIDAAFLSESPFALPVTDFAALSPPSAGASEKKTSVRIIWMLE